MSRLRILYVDDDHVLREIVRMALSRDTQIDLEACGSGEEALALLDRGAWRPDIILLDMMMPGMDGLAVLHALRTRRALDDVPVVFMTACPGEVTGAAAVILKPFDPLALAGTVRALAGG